MLSTCVHLLGTKVHSTLMHDHARSVQIHVHIHSLVFTVLALAPHGFCLLFDEVYVSMNCIHHHIHCREYLSPPIKVLATVMSSHQ